VPPFASSVSVWYLGATNGALQLVSEQDDILLLCKSRVYLLELRVPAEV
jgi:hypothetical protein